MLDFVFNLELLLDWSCDLGDDRCSVDDVVWRDDQRSSSIHWVVQVGIEIWGVMIFWIRVVLQINPF